jgi:hypothetical protein
MRISLGSLLVLIPSLLLAGAAAKKEGKDPPTPRLLQGNLFVVCLDIGDGCLCKNMSASSSLREAFLLGLTLGLNLFFLELFSCLTHSQSVLDKSNADWISHNFSSYVPQTSQ